MAHYLLAASSIPGHVAPLLELGADLVTRGHDVAFLVDPRYREAVHRGGMQHHPLPPAASSPPHPLISAAPGLVQRFLAGRHDMSSTFVAPMVTQWNALNELLGKHRVDAVLCDIAFTGAMPLLLSSRSRPRVVLCGVSPLMLSSRDAPPFGMAWQPMPFVDYRRMNRVVSDVLFRDLQTRLDDSLRSVGASKAPVFLTDWPRLADRVVQLSIPQLEYRRRDLPSTVTFAGPLLPRPGRAMRHRRRCAQTVVHVTQGTWDNHDLSELLLPTVRALGSRPDVAVVATTGRRGCTTLPITLPDNVFVTDYVPYGRLLPHVDIMVTNGGFGGVQQALAHGIPLVVAGAASDKPEVAARVAYTGAGIDLRTGRPGVRALAAAVDRVLTRPRYRNAAGRLAEQMLRYNAFDQVADALAEQPSVADEHVS